MKLTIYRLKKRNMCMYSNSQPMDLKVMKKLGLLVYMFGCVYGFNLDILKIFIHKLKKTPKTVPRFS